MLKCETKTKRMLLLTSLSYCVSVFLFLHYMYASIVADLQLEFIIQHWDAGFKTKQASYFSRYKVDVVK